MRLGGSTWFGAPASLGVFGSGAAANFSAEPRRPLVIGQIEFSPRQSNGEPRVEHGGRTWARDGNAPSFTAVGLRSAVGF